MRDTQSAKRRLVVFGLLAATTTASWGCDDASDAAVPTGVGAVQDGNAGASGTAGASGSAGAPEEPGPACTPVPEEVAKRRRCVSDDQCPCGAHCELGLCEASCSAALPCAAGLSCDAFGRCRDAGSIAAARVARVAPGTAARVAARTRVVQLGDDGTATVRVTRRDASPQRAIAGGGFLVSCAAGAPAAAECSLGEGKAGEEVTLSVSADPAAPKPPTTPGFVQLVSPTGATSLSVFPRAAAAVAPTLEPVSAAFRGTARLIDAGLGANARPITLPLRAELHAVSATTGLLVIRDGSRTLHPSGVWIGAVTYAPDGTANVAFPAHRAAGGSSVAGVQAEVLASVDPTPLALGGDRATRPIASLSPTVRFGGVTDGPPPSVTWSITLTFEDAPLSAPPSLPEAAAPTQEVSAAKQTRSGWELALQGLLTTPFGSLDAAAKVPLFKEVYQSQGSLQACGLSVDDVMGLADQAWADAGLASPITVSGDAKTSTWPGSDLHGTGSTGLVRDLVEHLYWQAALPGFSPPRGAASELALSITPSPTRPASLPDPLADAIPCGFAMPDARVTFTRVSPASDDCPSTLELPLPERPLSVCDDLAASIGCEPVLLDAPAGTAPSLATLEPGSHFRTIDKTDSSNTCDYALPTSFALPPSQITAVCRLRPRGTLCAERALCRAAGQPTDQDVRSLGANLSPVLLDSACTSGNVAEPDGPSFQLNLDRTTEDPSSVVSRDEMLSACLTDLQQLHDAPDFGGDKDRTALDRSVKNLCVDPAATMLALGELARVVRAGQAADTRAHRMFQRVLQRYLGVHAYIARTSTAQEQLRDVLVASGKPAPPAMLDVLARSLGVFDLVLSPRIADALLHLPGEALFDPDYRPSVGAVNPNPSATEEQLEAVPLTLEETLLAQLGLAQAIEDRAILAGKLDDGGRVGELLGRVPVVRALTRELRRKAVSAQAARPLPPWIKRLDETSRAVDAAVNRLLATQARVAAGLNPLGIEDADLPLYFSTASTDPKARFTAMSSYLVGTGPGDKLAWAPASIADAQAAYQLAETAYSAQQDRLFQRKKAAADVDQDLFNAKIEYGNRVCNYCGCTMAPKDLLDEWTDFDMYTCHLSHAPGCDPDPAKLAAAVPLVDLEYQLCVVQERLGVATDASAPVASDPDIDAVARALRNGATLSYPVPCPGTGIAACMSAGPATARLRVDGFSPPSNLAAELPGDVVATSGAAAWLGAYQNSDEARAKATCAAAFPTANRALPRNADLAKNAENPLCYRGSIGQQIATLRTLSLAVDAARSELSAQSEAYDIAMQSCLSLAKGNARIDEANADFTEIQVGLYAGKAAAETAADALEAAADCVPEDPGEGLAALLGLGELACSFQIAAATAKGVAHALEATIESLALKHDDLVTKIAGETEVDRCLIEARSNLVNVKTQSIVIAQSVNDLRAAQMVLNELQISADSDFQEGKAVLAAIQGRAVTPPAFDFWLDDKLTDYKRKLRIARRATYLAVRAVEYEYQASLPLRQTVLDAQTAGQLSEVLDTLRTTTGTLKINGAFPSGSRVAISLREQLLQLRDQTSLPEGEQTLSLAERFRIALMRPDYQVFDAKGVYLGQQIPFSIAPFEALGQKQQAGVAPIFAQNNCAERIWSVNANILGNALVNTPQAEIQILQRNTFYSQWCVPPEDGAQFQTASIRPTVNLLRDPSYGETLGSVDVGKPLDETQTFTRARIAARGDVPAATFQSDAYTDGHSDELAARAMFSDYVLFLPASSLSTGPSSVGIDLTRIEDITLRVDYVSVAK
jgi:hypothetical protein